MLDLAGLTDLFLEPSDTWHEPAVMTIHDLTRFEDEPLFQRLYAEGHAFRFVDGTRLRELAWNGWEPVIEVDGDGRPVRIVAKSWCWCTVRSRNDMLISYPHRRAAARLDEQ